MVRSNVAELRGALPGAEVRYAVKANPAEPVLRLLAGLHCTFDVASVGEIDLCAAAGIGGALMTMAIGWLGVRRLLATPPLLALRNGA